MLKFERQSGGHEKEVCAPQSRLVRALAAVPNVRAAAFRQSATEVGVEGLTAVATSTTAQTTLAGLAFNGLDGIAPTGRGLLEPNHPDWT